MTHHNSTIIVFLTRYLTGFLFIKNTPSGEPTSTRRFRYIRSSVATIYACLTSD